MSANQEIMNEEFCKDCNEKLVDGYTYHLDEGAVCVDCLDGYECCKVCKFSCSKLYDAEIGGCEKNICFDCLERMECCEMCSLPTDAEEWYDGKSFILYCITCYIRNEKIIVGKYGNIKKSEN